MARGKRYTAEQIIHKLRAIEVHTGNGMTVEAAAKRAGISVQSYVSLAEGIRQPEAGPGQASGSRSWRRRTPDSSGWWRS